MEKPHITLSNQWQLRRILTMLLTMAVVLSLLPATVYAFDPAAENCTSTATINCTLENASYTDKEEIAVSLFAEGCGTESDPYQIATAEQLDRVRCYPDKHFILTADIDLSGYENWEPIGTFKPLSDDPKDEETPDPEAAFTGTFNGNGYIISNLTINQPAGTAVGLFGCAVGDEKNPSSISNLTVKNADVTGYAFVGGMLGVQYLNGNLEGLSLTGDQNTVRGNTNVGGITGGSLSDMKDCNAAADIVLLGDGANHAGVLSGGLEDGSLLNCTATGGTVTVKGDNRYGVGGLAGCVIEGAAVTNCHADDVSITACGKNNSMIGGLLGHTGASDAEHPTRVMGCSADVTIIVSDSTSRVGGLVGSGFYLEQYKEYYPTPTMYSIVNCSTSGSITGGSESIGSIAGHAHNSTIENCTSTMAVNCASDAPQVGKEETGVVPPTTGILVVAHGSPEDEWNQPVRDAVEGIDCPYPVELGFLEFVEGEDIGTAVASLEEQGVEHIITVPIFVASASGHIEEIKYILGISSSITEEDAIEEGLEVVSHNAEIEMTSALDDHPLVAEILDDRIATVSQQADQEIVVLVAHGTSEEEDLKVWKNNLASLGQQLKENYQFLDVDYGFVAMGEPNVRAVVEAQQAENPGASVIVMPVMLSEGTFTSTTIPEVLSGLTYLYPAEGQRSLLPHDKISQLIVSRAYDAIGVFAGGNGTTESPYQIATVKQLDQVRNYLDKDFVLTADLDLSGYENWEPIGTFQPLSDDPEDEETPNPELAFTGTFNGNGYTISNLTIDQPEGMAVGLFGCVAGEQESPIHIYDLTLKNANVTGNFCVGGVVGFQYADSIMENITLTGDNRVQGNIYVGGILGGSDIGGGSAELRECNAAADIVLVGDAANSAGVLGGALNACSVIDCTATGTVIAEGEDYFALGGLIGGAFEGIEVINCHADNVSITACGKNNTMVGGLLGYAGTYGKQLPTQVTDCSANATIAVLNSTERVGGLVGGSFYHELAAEARPVPAHYAINSCNTSGSITGGGNEVGSIAGYAYDSTVENCTSTMTINRVSGNVSQVGLYESAFEGGNGTEESPYRITTAEQLDRVRYYLDKHFVLIADIDLSGYENWTPIGTFDENIFENDGHSDIAFSGTFDGNGHTVSNLTATHQDLVGVGLFSVASSDAVIKNLTVENASVTGYMSAAGIIGLNCGLVENLALKGENAISGINCIGGIIGGHGFGSVKNCTVEDVTINVLGDNDFSSGRIIQCDVAECGGLIIGGAFTGSIENCSALGEIIAEGNEPVGLGGIGGCLEYMENITGCTADVTITAPNSAHAVGGLCGYAGTGDTENPAVIENCSVKFVMNTANATHIGGLVGTGLYYMGMETVFSIDNCTIEGQINGAVTPGAIAGRAENCTIGSEISYDVKLDGNPLLAKIGTTDRMYESSDQPESVEDLSAWANSGSGSFESLVNYVNDDALSNVWNTAASSETAQMMAGMFGVNVTDGASLKAMFANMASAPANNGSQIYQIKFGYDCKTIYFCDQDGNVIESHPYTFVESNNSLGMLAGETTYVFKADDDAGVLTYIAMLKPHFDEGMDETTMPAHVHFYYAETKNTLSTYKPDSITLSSWMPTMLQMGDEFSTADKVAMLECLFGINNAFAGGDGSDESPYQIETAAQLDQVRYNLDKDFVLMADIDLAGYENWQPIGIFQPASSAPEDEENPDPEVAFSGTFDGNGHTISNLTINQPEGMAVGLFGCVVGTPENPCSIHDLKVENVDVTGSAFVGGVVGVQFLNGNLERLSLTGESNTVRGNANIGGITGGSLNDMKDCHAAADIVLRGDGANHAGVLSGGLEDGSLLNCTATGTVTAEGDNRYGVGGLAGCVIEGEAVANCHANGVTITALGENNAMIGGLLGHTGASDAEHKTQVTGCSADVTITVSDSTSRVGGLVGSGFYLEQYKEYYPTPTMYRIANCSTSGRIIGGSEAIGSIAGHAYNSIIENCTSTITTYYALENVPQVGKEETGISTPTTGILVVAHGSPEDEWNQPVRDAVEGIDCPYPVELGFLEFV
ncbi:TPA: hypothetical protein HA338_16920, partial [Methanosarcina acetivorans]